MQAPPHGRSEGFILPTAMIFIVFLGLVIGFTSTMYTYNHKKVLQEKRSTQAFYLAESGLTMAEYTLRDLGSVPSVNYAYPDGPTWLQSAGGDFNAGNSYKVWIARDADNNLVITSRGTTVDSYRVLRITASTSPFLDKLVETLPGRPYYSPDYRWDEYTFDPPGGLVSEGTLGPATISGSHKYDSINLGNSQALTINGPADIHVTGDVILNSGATLVIQGTGTVNFYVEGDFNAKNGSLISTYIPFVLNLPGNTQKVTFMNGFSGDAENSKYFLIKVATTGYANPPTADNVTFDLKNRCHTTMAIFAPNSTISFKGSTGDAIIGSVVARIATGSAGLPAGDFITYDAKVGNIPIDGGITILRHTWSDIN